MGLFDRILGRKTSEPRDEGIYFYVRCDNCGRVLHTRLDPERELTPRDEGGYEVRKEMMDDRCFRPIELRATFDGNRTPLDVDVQGGTLIDRESWEAEKDLPRRPPLAESESEGDL
ncbi:MAG: hypothetical protein ACRDIB_19355 [Ardenticatenaceae bacterium]